MWASELVHEIKHLIFEVEVKIEVETSHNA